MKHFTSKLESHPIRTLKYMELFYFGTVLDSLKQFTGLIIELS